jgi:hypothetical protein
MKSIFSLSRATFAIALSFSLFSCILAQPFLPKSPPQAPNSRNIAQKIVTKHTEADFVPSLETKESADFLLVPAIIAQLTNPKEPIQFDAILTLKGPILRTHVTLFARYWVASNSYQIGVIWAEPHGRFLQFPTYPPTLRIFSSATNFQISHDLATNIVTSFTKPIPSQDTFTNQFGDYPITQIRFAEDEWRKIALKLEPADRGSPAKTLPTFQQLRILESPVKLRLSGEGAQIRIRDTNYTIREIMGANMRGGRILEAAYSSNKTDFGAIRLPERIVMKSPTGFILERADISGICKANMVSPESFNAAVRYGGFNEEDRKYRPLLDKYWKRPPTDVTKADELEARKLIGLYTSNTGRDESIGEKLKRINILMELTRMIGDSKSQMNHYRRYLECLRDNHLDETLLVGGQTAIDTLMIWRRSNEAKALIDIWTEYACKVDADKVLEFVEREFRKRNFVTALKLLDAYASNETTTERERTLLDDLRSQAKREIDVLVTASKSGDLDEVSAAEVQLAAAIF